ncbi:MAG: phytanoyl-CoA dioxygenase family protein [Myxococcales bacterium]|nr:phytanoyl-CoA dioxygenase family protein [Myxococcales bacterium]
MIRCIQGVRAAGLPPVFALVYDVFFAVFADLDATLRGVLGEGYRIMPNFWIYHIEPADHDHGFEPHRDAEYADTIGPDGLPTVLTVWLALTDAVPLNSCMYVVPAGRDPDYARSIGDLTPRPPRFALEDIRALPAVARSMSCWTQYIYHWGSRSSRRAAFPRLSYALYCHRGDVAPVDQVLEVPSTLRLVDRLAYACRGLARYSYLALRDAPDSQPILDFFEAQLARVGLTGAWSTTR